MVNEVENCSTEALAIVLALGFRKIARDAAQQSQRVIAKLNASIQETVTGISVAKAHRAEKQVYDDFRKLISGQ